MTIDLAQPTVDIPRDRYGRPMVRPPGGGKPVAYTRCTTFVSALEDTYNLSRWQMRMVAAGLASRPDLLLAVAAHSDDKAKMNEIAAAAMEAAAAHAAATTGTALHALTERIDRGQDVGVVPEAYLPDLAAYISTTAPLEPVLIECFTVEDTLHIGGTPDRIVRYDGNHYIADVKTGSIEWGIGKIAQQLAVYAHSKVYDFDTGTRTDLPNVDLREALIIHLPAGTGTCELVWVDIAAGWAAVQLSHQVRTWRARKDLTRPFVRYDNALVKAINAAQSVADLEAVWTTYADVWTADDTKHAAAKKKSLLTGAAGTTTHKKEHENEH